MQRKLAGSTAEVRREGEGSQEAQRHREEILDAAADEFGARGYKGAHSEDIARRAGISKGLLFFYFHNKRELYLSVVERLTAQVEPLVIDEGFWAIDDFFDRILYAVDKRADVLTRFPRLMAFSVRAFYPEHRDVRDAMGRWIQRWIDTALPRYFHGVDLGRFRDDVSPSEVMNWLIWLADGYMHARRSVGRDVDLAELLEQCRRWCAMLRGYAYKEEYR